MSSTATRIAKEVDVATLALHPLIQKYRHEEKLVQREARVDWLVTHWNPAALERITCVPRDIGGFWVTDGGHRLEAARRLELPTLPADVIYGLNGDSQASLVTAALSQVDVRQWTRLGRFLLARDAVLHPESDIDSTLRKFGPGVEAQTTTGFVCVDKLAKAYDLGVLDVVAEVINGAWPQDGVARSGLVVEALTRFQSFYGTNPIYQKRTFIEKLAKRHSRSLQLEAQSKGRALRRSPVVELVTFMVDIYNHGRKDRLPAFEPGRGFKK